MKILKFKVRSQLKSTGVFVDNINYIFPHVEGGSVIYFNKWHVHVENTFENIGKLFDDKHIIKFKRSGDNNDFVIINVQNIMNLVQHDLGGTVIFFNDVNVHIKDEIDTVIKIISEISTEVTPKKVKKSK